MLLLLDMNIDCLRKRNSQGAFLIDVKKTTASNIQPPPHGTFGGKDLFLFPRITSSGSKQLLPANYLSVLAVCGIENI